MGSVVETEKPNVRGGRFSPPSVCTPCSRLTRTSSPDENGDAGLKTSVFESSDRTHSPACLPLTEPTTERASTSTVDASISLP